MRKLLSVDAELAGQDSRLWHSIAKFFISDVSMTLLNHFGSSPPT